MKNLSFVLCNRFLANTIEGKTKNEANGFLDVCIKDMIIQLAIALIAVAKGASASISFDDDACRDAIRLCQFSAECVNRISERIGYGVCDTSFISDVGKRDMSAWGKKRNDPTRLWSLLRKLDRIPSGK
ncbi:hypothetical protein Tcan_12331 [Toxocara canis]|uniref:Uncharacterized protein n=1 Tax=Toxocara canis TaxID=6265 RepID=A0A0B2VRH0_TOXCA|nr:hypothetical protein Tcan_12331 [Toxocara canis]